MGLAGSDPVAHWFEKIGVNQRGHFCNDLREEIPFPSGFFDSTLQELLEMG